MLTETPMMMVFNYIDSMIHDNIDWLELKQKALMLESQSLENAEKRGYDKCLQDLNSMSDEKNRY